MAMPNFTAEASLFRAKLSGQARRHSHEAIAVVTPQKYEECGWFCVLCGATGRWEDCRRCEECYGGGTSGGLPSLTLLRR